MKTVTLLISCPDNTGIVAKISNCLLTLNCNIIQSDQHSTGHEGGHFFMRVKFAYNSKGLSKETINELLGQVAKQLNASLDIYFEEDKKSMGILVSKYDHCLMDLLYRWKAGTLNVDIPWIISNHPDLRPIADFYGINYHYIACEKNNKFLSESQILSKVDGVDFIVLARYMQVLSNDFLEKFSKPVINIHHSFLPSFKGARPYHQAFDKGVKIIGATAHYVTEDLDEGPIIAQQVIGASHKDDVNSLALKGQDVEKAVLADSISAHVDNKIILHGNKTVVFS